MPEKGEKWKLYGKERNRSFDKTITFIKKETVPVANKLVEAHMEAAMKRASENPLHKQAVSRVIKRRFGSVPDDDTAYWKKYREIVSMDEQAVFHAGKESKVIVSPRHDSFPLGSNSDGRGNTICTLMYDGEFFAVAYYNEEKKEIKIDDY